MNQNVNWVRTVTGTVMDSIETAVISAAIVYLMMKRCKKDKEAKLEETETHNVSTPVNYSSEKFILWSTD